MSNATTSAARSPALRDMVERDARAPGEQQYARGAEWREHGEEGGRYGQGDLRRTLSATFESRTTVTTNMPSTTGPSP